MNMAVRLPPRSTKIKMRLVAPRKPSHKGPRGRAKTLSPEQFQTALDQCAHSHFPTRDRLMLKLSYYAGLRAQEIAWLEFSDITDVTGKIVPVINVSKRAAKYGKERSIPMHASLFEAISSYVTEAGITDGPIFTNRFGDQMSPNAVQKQIAFIYRSCRFRGASSHSGRRTFITTLARRVGGESNTSLKDVQAYAGHASISTTETYIEGSDSAAKLVMGL